MFARNTIKFFGFNKEEAYLYRLGTQHTLLQVFFMEKVNPFRGILISDIDGTISFLGKPIEEAIIEYFACLAKKGWAVVFATGRTKDWAFQSLDKCYFPHFVAVFNGAMMWKRVPLNTQNSFKEELVYSHLISRDIIEKIFKCRTIYENGALIYEGGENKRIFSLKNWRNPFIFDHVLKRKKIQKEEWLLIDSIEMLPANVLEAASVRFFVCEGDKTLHALKKELEERTHHFDIVTPLMKDSFNSKISIIQITSQLATKAAPISALRGNQVIPVIALGDDHNDLSMLKVADCAIGINGCNDDVRDVCHIITNGATADAVLQAIDNGIEVLRI